MNELQRAAYANPWHGNSDLNNLAIRMLGDGVAVALSLNK